MKLSEYWKEGHPVFKPIRAEIADEESIRIAKFKHQAIQILLVETAFVDPETQEIMNDSPFYMIDFMGSFCMN